jgi:hypothetical protein
MDPPSTEQQYIIDLIAQRESNVYVDACAGSGKSRTVLSCASQVSQKQFLQVTYNKNLRKEVQDNVKHFGLNNIQIHTYHSLAYAYYGTDGQTDEGLRNILRERRNSIKPLLHLDILVIDEAQDMTKLYFDFLWYFLIQLGKPVQILVLGDKRQGLYEFKGADIRFLTMASECWKHHPFLISPTFDYTTLNTSYRITIPMAKFVNEYLLGEERLEACKPGVPVIYVRKDRYSNEKTLIGMIYTLIQEGAKYEDIFILCGSVKGNTVRRLENLLVEKNMPCYVPFTDNQEDMDQRIIDKKIVFSTFHTVKGRQRKFVFVLEFDLSYFLYNARTHDREVCPNTIYVACTRATEKLFIFENNECDPFPFLQKSHLDMMQSEFISFRGLPCVQRPLLSAISNSLQNNKYYLTPTKLIRFLSESVLDKITPILQNLFVTVQSPTDSLTIRSVFETKNGFFEDVSDVNGIVLPILFYDRLTNVKTPILQNLVRHYMKDVNPKQHEFLHQLVKTMPLTCETIQDYLYMASLSITTQEKLYSRISQIATEEYNWLDKTMIDSCCDRYRKAIGEECKKGEWVAEHTILHETNEMDHINIDSFFDSAKIVPNTVFRFTARTDFMSQESIWEMKCTGQLTTEHKLQLVIYMWLYHMTPEKELKKGFLFNVKTNELLQLTGNVEDWSMIIIELIHHLFKDNKHKSDEEFLYDFIP